MVKSKSSCFSIIACGSDSAENDDVKPTEIKASTDKRGWSFRKRSTRHRVLSNTVTSEVQSTGYKDGPEAAPSDISALTNPMVPEKTSLLQWKDETMQSIPSDAVNSNLTDTVTEVSSYDDQAVPESVAILIQSAIRIYLAKKALYKLKNIVKSQAVVRGHLVRRQAVGTLRCVQAIVKMQALVRARRVRMSLEGLSVQEKHDGEIDTDNRRLNSLEYSGSGTNSSIKTLLANGFACQLLESKPKTKPKPIYINCDPAKSESAWNWLERWMSVSSSDIVQPQTSQVDQSHRENGVGTDSTASDIGTRGSAKVVSECTKMKSGVDETERLIEGEENSNAHLADDFEFHAHKPKAVSSKTSSSAPEDNLDGRLDTPEETSAKLRKVLKDATDSVSSQVDIRNSQTKHSTSSDNPELSNEHLKDSVERLASEQIGNEGKKFAFGSKKSKNPSFAAPKSKFEELSSTATSGGSVSFGYHDAAVESRLDSPSWTGSVSKDNDLSITEDLISHEPRFQMWGSECGTVLSISSTLDSPDRPEAEGEQCVHEIISTDKELKNLDAEANDSSMFEIASNSSRSVYVKPDKIQEAHGDSGESKSPAYATEVQHPSELIVSDVGAQVNTVTEQHLECSSAGGSPRSHITVTDFHGTPSSQVSQTSVNDKSDNSFPSKKRPSQSSRKRSVPKQSHDSVVRNVTEHFPVDSKIGKRRNSLDHEPRATSSNSLPSYMQATESARAKAHMSHSPRSSPDVQDKDSYLNKRHSLPATTGKQNSPRMQRSTSQAQQNVKRNTTHSPQTATERKWQR